MERDVAMVTKAFETILTQTTTLPTTRFEEFVIYLTLNMKKSYPMTSETHKIALLDVNHSDEPQLLLGLIVPAVYPHAVVALANIAGTDSHYWYDIDAGKWEKVSPLKLTPAEIMMLRLSMQGYSHEQIAQILNKTSHTIKYYRRCIFDKLGVNNIAQAISVAISACII